MFVGTNSKGEKQAVAAVSPSQIRTMPIEHLGTMLKSVLVKAEDAGAEALYLYVRIGEQEDFDPLDD